MGPKLQQSLTTLATVTVQSDQATAKELERHDGEWKARPARCETQGLKARRRFRLQLSQLSQLSHELTQMCGNCR